MVEDVWSVVLLSPRLMVISFVGRERKEGERRAGGRGRHHFGRLAGRRCKERSETKSNNCGKEVPFHEHVHKVHSTFQVQGRWVRVQQYTRREHDRNNRVRENRIHARTSDPAYLSGRSALPSPTSNRCLFLSSLPGIIENTSFSPFATTGMPTTMGTNVKFDVASS